MAHHFLNVVRPIREDLNLRDVHGRDSTDYGALQNGNGVPNVRDYAQPKGAPPATNAPGLVNFDDDERFGGEMHREPAIVDGD